jgi:predicted O-methyltransferase YrrM
LARGTSREELVHEEKKERPVKRDVYFLADGLFVFYEGPFCDDRFNVYYVRPGKNLWRMSPQMERKDLEQLRLFTNSLPDNAVVYEIGAYVGHSTCVIGGTLRDNGGHLTTIDSFKGNAGTENGRFALPLRSLLEENLRKHGLTQTVTILEGTSRSFPVPLESVDMVFLDGDHRYSEISQDIAFWWDRLKPGGLMVGHDLNSNTWDEQYIEQDTANTIHHGVAKAVVERFGPIHRDSNRVTSIWSVRKISNNKEES